MDLEDIHRGHDDEQWRRALDRQARDTRISLWLDTWMVPILAAMLVVVMVVVLVVS